ncbi:MAG: EAL domain-containing protein [Pseudomonadota bacterium]
MSGLFNGILRSYIGIVRRTTAKELWKRYAVGLAVLLILVVVSHFAALSALNSARSHAGVVVASIGQRPVVQRIMFLSSMAVSERTSALNDQLKVLIQNLKGTHEKLSRDPGNTSALKQLYVSGRHGPALDPIMKTFIADATIVATAHGAVEREAAFARMQTVGPETLPRVFDEAAELYRSTESSYADQVGTVQSAAFAAALLVLFLEALFIFTPSQLAARQALRRLETQSGRLRRVRNNLRVRKKQLQGLRQSAEYEAYHDGLTGLANRRSVEPEIARRSEMATEPQLDIAVINIGLDRFKGINDTLGHAAGDYILAHVAKVLRHVAGPNDFLARTGGDEFVIVRGTDGGRSALDALAAQLIERISQPISYHGELCHIGASVGIDTCCRRDIASGFDPACLLANAGIALYRAKELGRGRVEFFYQDLRVQIQRSKALSDEISLAVYREEFFPVYQTQVDARSGKLAGVEALARWQHPIKGELSPGVFLPTAECLGVVSKIDHIILNKALDDFAKWESMGLHVPQISVNVSSDRLRDADFIASLDKLDLPEGRLAFEILETVFTDNADDDLLQTLSRLKSKGIDIEVDDFGTGHASLIGLLSLGPTRLKIDREFVKPLPDSKPHVSLLKSIIEIASSLNIGVTAEGVETAAQRDALIALGSDRLQGFFFSRPITSEELIAKLKSEMLVREHITAA